MAVDPKKREKKLQRRAAKTKEKRRDLVRESSGGMPGRLAAAASFPIVDSLVGATLWTHGIASVLLSREVGSSEIAIGLFLVDRFCLGVKNVMVDIIARSEYQSRFLPRLKKGGEVIAITPATARRYIESAAAYANSLGIAPHADYARGRLLFGDIDPAAATDSLEFGKDGKPYFVAGPSDGPIRCRQIINMLRKSCGEGAYDFLMPIGDETVKVLSAD